MYLFNYRCHLHITTVLGRFGDDIQDIRLSYVSFYYEIVKNVPFICVTVKSNGGFMHGQTYRLKEFEGIE